MTLAQARSLCAGLVVHDQAAMPDEDAAALRRLARWMLRFAPVVAPDHPDGLLLDIAGCQHLFGGERLHVRQMAEALRRYGLRPRLAVAPTFACAWAVARFGDADIAHVADDEIDGALSALPIDALRLDGHTIDALGDIGIERIGQLTVLSRDDLAARYGRELLSRLDQATGRASDRIQNVHTPNAYVESHLFDGPIRRVEIVEATTRELLARLLAQLERVNLGILELSIVLRRIDIDPQEFVLRLTLPSRDHAHLWKLLVPRLERMHLGFGVEEITLHATRTDVVQHAQAAFLRDIDRSAPHATAALGELVDCLMDRLGGGAITQIETVESYVPEQAFVHATTRATVQPASARKRADGPAANLAERPSLLFDRPEPVRVMSVVPDGPPIWLEWRGRERRIVRGVGPERITAPWWTDRPIPPRDYYDVQDTDGCRLWVYRDAGSGNWFVHGQWI